METTADGRGSRIDGRFLTGLTLLLLLGPYLPVPGLPGKPLRLDHILLPLAGVSYLLLGFKRGELSLASPIWHYLLFLGSLIFSTLIQDESAEGLAGGLTLLAGMDSYLRPGILLFIAFNLRLTAGEFKGFLRVILLTSIPLCLLGILQALPVTSHPVNTILYALYNNGFPTSLEAYATAMEGKGLSVFGQVPTFAMFCLFGLAVITGHGLGNPVFRSRALTWLALACLVGGGIASGDLLFGGGALLFCLLILLLSKMPCHLIRPRRVLGIVITGSVLICAVFLFLRPQVKELHRSLAFSASGAYSNYVESRLGTEAHPELGKLHRTGAIKAFRSNPFFGQGFWAINKTTDSFIFGLLAMGGISGMLFFLVFLFSLLRGLNRLTASEAPPQVAALALPLRILTLVFLLGSFGFHTFIQDRAADLFWLTAGILLSSGLIWPRESRSRALPSGDGIRLPAHIAIQQRVLPLYRVPFFESLARHCRALELFAGSPLEGEAIHTGNHLAKGDLAVVKNIHTASQNRWSSCWQMGLLSRLEVSRADLLVCEGNPRILSTLLAIALFKSLKKPVVGWGLGMLPWASSAWVTHLRSALLRRFYSSFDAVITYSSKGAGDYRALGIPAERIFIAPNAVSSEEATRLLEQLRLDRTPLLEWKRKHGLDERPIVLSVGRLIPEKRIGDLIRACATLQEHCQLVIVGDGPELESIRELAADVLPASHVLGALHGEPLALAFAAADLFVMPGSGGLAMQEAMTYGLPIIVGSGDGTQADLVRKGKNGLQVAAGDLISLRRAVEGLLLDPERREMMSAESFRIIREEHNLDFMVEAFLHALSYALKHHSSPVLLEDGE